MSESVSVHVYCGNYLTAPVSMFEEPPECSAEADVVCHRDDLLHGTATYTCPGCGATNAVRDHEVTGA
jgi:predicted RNA-binding Zn-ribbon protein involved in translation (DUF1610 family)